MIDLYTSQRDIVTALHTIQEECNSHDDCFGCPFRLDLASDFVKCGVRDLDPCNWDINDNMDWRAFK